MAGGGGLAVLTASFGPRHFWVNNPYDFEGRVKLQVNLPDFLTERGWGADPSLRRGRPWPTLERRDSGVDARPQAHEVSMSRLPNRSGSPAVMLLLVFGGGCGALGDPFNSGSGGATGLTGTGGASVGTGGSTSTGGTEDGLPCPPWAAPATISAAGMP